MAFGASVVCTTHKFLRICFSRTFMRQNAGVSHSPTLASAAACCSAVDDSMSTVKVVGLSVGQAVAACKYARASRKSTNANDGEDMLRPGCVIQTLVGCFFLRAHESDKPFFLRAPNPCWVSFFLRAHESDNPAGAAMARNDGFTWPSVRVQDGKLSVAYPQSQSWFRAVLHGDDILHVTTEWFR